MNDQRPIIVAQRVRWGPSDGRSAGIRVWNAKDEEDQFVPWSVLQLELKNNLLPQLFASPAGFTFDLRDYHSKKDWLMQIFRNDTQSFCDVWFGDDPDNAWQFDGLVRVGDAENQPYVWQTYQRYSDGTYRRLSGLTATLDEYERGRGPQPIIRRPSMP